MVLLVNDFPPLMNFQTLIRSLSEEDSDLAEISVAEDGNTVEAYDNFDDRYVTFHKSRTASQLSEIVFIGPDAKGYVPAEITEQIGEILTQTDQNMLLLLNHVVIVASDQDMQRFCVHADIPCDAIPDLLDFEFGGCIGVFWYEHNNIVIDVHAIREACKDYCFTDYEINCEERIGFWTTLLHELRHLGLANPFLPEDDYPINLASEDSVEVWGRRETEKLGFVFY